MLLYCIVGDCIITAIAASVLLTEIKKDELFPSSVVTGNNCTTHAYYCFVIDCCRVSFRSLLFLKESVKRLLKMCPESKVRGVGLKNCFRSML